MTDLELAGMITSLLPKEYYEKLSDSFDRFEADILALGSNSEAAKIRFKRYMEIYWLTLYNNKNDYKELREYTHEEWRKKSTRLCEQLKRKAAIA